MIGVAVIGSTGTIGDNTLDVLARHPQRFRVVALGARRNVAKLLVQCRQFRPDYAALADPEAARELETGLREAGLPTRVLVMAGALLVEVARAAGSTLLPIDSEHNAIFQCLPHASRAGEPPGCVRRLLLTASGGPFLDWSAAQIEAATPAQACAHPKWVMGRKISVDSATLMNKGLEVIEAGILFGLPESRIEVVVHRQSIVHSLVEYVDGSMLAQLGAPDMRTPIAHALAWPERCESGVQSLDLVKAGVLEFQAPDLQRFRCLALAQAAARAGGVVPAILNAANEVAVEAFLEGRLNFPGIAEVIERVVTTVAAGPACDLEAVLVADAEGRRVATAECRRLVSGARGLDS